MNLPKNILIIFLCTHLGSIKALPKRAILLSLRDLQTSNIIYDVPLQVTYGGFFTSSNHNGQIILPRKTQDLDFYILITNQIIPIFSILNNISHLQIITNTPAAMYHITTTINPITDKLEWLTSLADIPKDQHIPLHTIIIFADPNNVTMQLGPSNLQLDTHLILPNIYLNLPFVNHNFSLLLPNIRPFLGKLETAYALTPYGYATIQTQ